MESIALSALSSICVVHLDRTRINVFKTFEALGIAVDVIHRSRLIRDFPMFSLDNVEPHSVSRQTDI